MILDNLLMMSDGQDLSTTVGGWASYNVIDLKGFDVTASQDAPYGVDRDIGKGNYLPLLCQVTETFASVGAATLVVVLEVDDDVAFGSATPLYTSKTFALAELVAGTLLLPQVIPFGSDKRYMRLVYTIGGATTTAGRATCSIPTAIQSNSR